MTTKQDQSERESSAIRGQQILDQLTKLGFRPEDDGKFIAIDVNSSAYEIDANDFTATERLLGREPNARMWLARIGRRAAYNLGSLVADRVTR